MTTKEWLSRAINIDREIGRLMRERRKAYERCLSITSRVNATCVTSTKDPHKYDTLSDYENLIDTKVDELYDTKQEIQKAIFSISDPILRELLQRRYVNGESFERISCMLYNPQTRKKYSYRHIVMELHPKALKEIEKIISNIT